MVDLHVATTNRHKLIEIAEVLEPMGVRVVGLDTITLADGSAAADLAEPIEDADTFAQNASIKASYYAKAIGRPCLADDSGLVVDALDGAPGVRSARYAGVDANRDQRDKANNQKLLRELALVPQKKRTARFVCAMCFASPTGQTLAQSEGVFQGVITDSPRGANGFGYDPLLELPDGRTSAELSSEEKNERSHRGAALCAIAPKLIEALKRSNR